MTIRTSPRANQPEWTGHDAMLGARLICCLPSARKPPGTIETQPMGLFLVWLAYAGVLSFGGSMLVSRGALQRLIDADPTGLTLVILLVFAGSTAWCGWRAWVLCRVRESIRLGFADSWQATFSRRLRSGPDQADMAHSLLLECAYGPHEMGWWLNGIQLKLGLLGKVIGFSMLALELGSASFEPSQSSELLRSLLGGLGLALLATLVGLTGNILLGLQLIRLDRYADSLVAEVYAREYPLAPTLVNGREA